MVQVSALYHDFIGHSGDGRTSRFTPR